MEPGGRGADGGGSTADAHSTCDASDQSNLARHVREEKG